MTQITVPVEISDPIDTTGTKKPREIVRNLMYYGRDIDITMLIVIGTLAESANTQYKAQDITKLMNYCATHPYATVCLHHRNMCLKIHSEASYLS